jgi:hypothetical protein
MGDFKIKLMKDGFDISDVDIRNFILSSEYSMLKYHSDNTAQLTVTAGNTEGYVDISHNLGYVPVYIAYVEHAWMDPLQRILPQGRAPQPSGISAWVSSSKVRCRINMIDQEVDRTFNFRVIIFKDKII